MKKRTTKEKIFEFLRNRFPPYRMRGSHSTVFGIPIFGDHHDKIWFKWTIWPIAVLLRSIDDVYFWIYYRVFDRKHIVNTGLTPGWCDVDEIMFRACFALLGRYVEEELGEPWSDDPEDFGGSSYKGYRLHFADDAHNPQIDLWLWYKNELPALEKEYDDYLRHKYSKPLRTKKADGKYGEAGLYEILTPELPDDFKIDERFEEYGYVERIKDEKLRELIDMRRGLWT